MVTGETKGRGTSSPPARRAGNAGIRDSKHQRTTGQQRGMADGHDACMPPAIMQSIIRQNANRPVLPDFRNLGTILRILVAVNAGAVLYAFARAPSPSAMFDEWTAATAVVEPYLFLVLAALWLASPRLARLPFSTGAVFVALVTVLAGMAWFEISRLLRPQPGVVLLTWLVWALLATSALLLYFQLRSRALSPAIAEARLQALQARIRPHFLFNSINAVLSLVRGDPARAEEALQDMADLFRVLMRDNRDLAPLADEVELCRQYLELEQLRLGERLRVDWNVKSMPGDALVPPLMLQPLLENAVYHGIEPSSEPGVVSINLFLTRGEVHAILKNPYRAQGGRHHSGNKMALANVRERLALHFDAEASLDSRVTKDGYEVHIRIPYRTVSPPVAADRPAGAEAPAAPRKANGAVRRGPTVRVLHST
jgi:two-component system sensor histidine kinase AlgZ